MTAEKFDPKRTTGTNLVVQHSEYGKVYETPEAAAKANGGKVTTRPDAVGLYVETPQGFFRLKSVSYDNKTGYVVVKK
jgi:hypothetical protein